MKKIGIVGGVAWRSTVDYYSEICRRSQHWHRARKLRGLPSTPEMSIESLDLNKAVSYLGIDGDEDSWVQFDSYHRPALQRLEASGVDFAIIASNTPHHRFASIAGGIGIPVINMFDAFREEFARHGIEAAGPPDDAARAKMAGLITDLQLGKLKGAAARLGRIAKTAFQPRFTAQPAVCLACTELPLALPEQKMLATFEYDGVSYINAMAVHLNAAFDFAVDERSS